jgi:hypothetical protein
MLSWIREINGVKLPGMSCWLTSKSYLLSLEPEGESV